MKQGLLIAIEAPSRQLAETQSKLLAKRLAGEVSLPVSVYNFPDASHQASYFASADVMGKYGSNQEILEHYRALFYSFERYDRQPDISRQLDKPTVTIVTGYTAGTMASLGVGISDDAQRRGFYLWLDNFEENGLKIQRPDVSVLLGSSSSKARSIDSPLMEIKKLFPKNHLFIDIESDTGEQLSIANINSKIWDKVKTSLEVLPPPATNVQSGSESTILDQDAPPDLAPLLKNQSRFTKRFILEFGEPNKLNNTEQQLGLIKNYLTPLGCMPMANQLGILSNDAPTEHSNMPKRQIRKTSTDLPGCQLISFSPNNELSNTEEAIFSAAEFGQDNNQQLTYEQKIKLYKKQLESARKDLPLPQYRIEFMSSISMYMEFLALKIGSFVTAKKISPYIGNITPKFVKHNHSLNESYQKCFNSSQTVYRKLATSGQGQSALLGGHLLIWRATLNAPEIKQLLSTNKEAEIYQSLLEQLAERHPMTAKWLREQLN